MRLKPQRGLSKRCLKRARLRVWRNEGLLDGSEMPTAAEAQGGAVARVAPGADVRHFSTGLHMKAWTVNRSSRDRCLCMLAARCSTYRLDQLEVRRTGLVTDQDRNFRDGLIPELFTDTAARGVERGRVCGWERVGRGSEGSSQTQTAGDRAWTKDHAGRHALKPNFTTPPPPTRPNNAKGQGTRRCDAAPRLEEFRANQRKTDG